MGFPDGLRRTLMASSGGTPRLRLTDRCAQKVADAVAKKVLVVDDCRDSTEMIGMLLESAGHVVASAHDGPAALDLYDRVAPDVVLLDISLPGMTGHEVCRRILKRGQRPKAIVAMTGWQKDEVKGAVEEAGFTHHLLKPIDPAGLVALIERIGP